MTRPRRRDGGETPTAMARLILRVAPSVAEPAPPLLPPIAKLSGPSHSTPDTLRAVVVLDGRSVGEIAEERICVVDLAPGDHRLDARAVSDRGAGILANGSLICIVASGPAGLAARVSRRLRGLLAKEHRLWLAPNETLELGCWFVLVSPGRLGEPALELEFSEVGRELRS